MAAFGDGFATSHNDHSVGSTFVNIDRTQTLGAGLAGSQEAHVGDTFVNIDRTQSAGAAYEPDFW